LVDIGFAVVARLAIRRVARPFMVELSRDTGESCELCMLDGADVVVVDRVEAQTPLRVVDDVGARAPAQFTAAGKAMLAELDATVVDQLVPETRLQPPTSRSISSRVALRTELDLVREAGFATTRQEFDDDLVGLAAAVLDDHGAVRGALTLPLPVTRVDEDFEKTLGPRVVHQARAIGRALDNFEASP
jgi:DNA-binding IclR family transcriptional regulator